VASARPGVLAELETVRVRSMDQGVLLQLFGLQWNSDEVLDYLTLDEALSGNVLDVMEVSAGGRVSVIKVSNRSERMVFLMDGEVLAGCKQDRVLNTSILVPAKNDLSIPVACVEMGRWSYRSSKFQSGLFSSHITLRKVLSKTTSAHYKANGVPRSDQRAVWGEIARKMQAVGSASDTGALKDMFQDYRARLNQIQESLSAPAGCHGAVFAFSGKILGADLFDKPSTLVKLWPKMISCYALDVVDGQKNTSHPMEPQSVREWLKSATVAKENIFDSPGVGQDVRIEGESVIGGALVVGDSPVHLHLLPIVSDS
jgi:hypothetical protein